MIAMSDLHLSVSSACHFEALGIGTPTGILALPGHELVLDLAERGDAVLIDSPAALADAGARTVAGARYRTQTSDHYFRRDHIENMRAVLAECSADAGKIEVITIVDYGTSNLGSMQNMLKKIGASSRIAAVAAGSRRRDQDHRARGRFVRRGHEETAGIRHDPGAQSEGARSRRCRPSAFASACN